MMNQRLNLQREAGRMTTQLTLPQLEALRASCLDDETEPQTPDTGTFQALVVSGLQNITQLICQPGEVICQEGEPGDALYLIRSGHAAIVKGGFDAPVVLACRGAGEFVGEMALLEDLPRSASVVALDEMQLLVVEHEDFLSLLSGNIKLDIGLLRKLSGRLRASDDAYTSVTHARRTLSGEVSHLSAVNQQLLELQRLRDQTTDLIIHDLRNPLQGISGAIGLLRMVLPEETQQENHDLLQLIADNCDRMQRLIDSLLDISRLESGEAELVREPSNLPGLLEAALMRTMPVLQTRGITSHFSLPPDLPMVSIDVHMIDRVVTNLLDNAIKFIPGAGAITVRAEPRGAHVAVSVNDTGFGIPPEQREQVFERFARGSSGSHQRGFGLGLTFCRLAVQAHGGRIWVEDGEGGVGCKFIFTLPVDLSAP